MHFNIVTDPIVTVTRLQTQCQESCIDIIQANANGTVFSQGALVSSAVDAMFHFRAPSPVDEDEVQDGTNTGTPHTDSNVQGDDLKKSQVQSPYRKINQDGTDMNMDFKRPLRLPPLIQKLVGTVDTTTTTGMNSPHLSSRKRVRPNIYKKQQQQPNETMQRRVSNQRNENTSRSSGTVDSVAKVAAAAAAAVLSEPERRGSSNGKLSMKAHNEQWEEALMWIASWGQKDKNEAGQTASQSKTQKRERKKRKQDSSKNRDNEVLEFLDKCIDSCISKEGSFSLPEKGEGKSVTYNIPDTNAPLPILHLRDTIESIHLTTIRKIKSFNNVLFSFRSNQQIIRGIFGMVLCTAAVLFIRNASDWRKLHRYTKSLRSLLEEESDETGVKNDRPGKNPRGKKAKRKKREQRGAISKESSANAPIIKTYPKEECAWDEKLDNESVSSVESLDYKNFCEDRHVKKHQGVQKSVFEDQGSKDNGTSSTSSITTDDADAYEEFRKVAVDIKIKSPSKRVPSNKSGKHLNQHSREKRTEYTSDNLKDSDLRGIGTRTSPKHLSPPKYLSAPSPGGPTQEQREQAHRQLLEFQQARIQQYLIDQATNEMRIRQAKSTPLRNMTISGVLSPSSVSPIHFARDSLQTNDQEGTDVGKLVLDLLDEEEDHGMGGDSLQTDDLDAVSSCQSQRVIALGDLLVGSYSFEKSSPSSNPWKHKIFEGEGESDQFAGNSRSKEMEDDTHPCADANFCLQASARSFSPAWNSTSAETSKDFVEKHQIW